MNERLDRFVALSALLTGFNRVELLGTGMADAYLRTVEEGLGPDSLDALLAAYDRLPEDGREAAAATDILGDEALGQVARNVILLWYCGTWEHQVVSGEAYVAGLQWAAAGAHPMGARQQGYGAWAAAPGAIGR